MDKLLALRYYSAAYMAAATQLRTLRHAREWMETMPNFRAATRDELDAHAAQSAQWASAGYLPAEAAPLIADGMDVATATAADPRTEQERMEYLADRIRMMGLDG